MALPPFTPFSVPDHYTCTVESTSNDLQHTWRNSMDMVYPAGVPPTPSDPILVNFYTWLAGMQRSDSHISKLTMRQWSRGDLPFSEQGALFEIVLNVPGFCYDDGGMVSGVGNHGTTIGEICAEVIKPVFSGKGKPGRLFLRNFYRDIDITSAPGGPPVLTGAVPGPGQTEFNTWAASRVNIYTEDNPLPRFCIMHWSRVHSPSTYFETAVGHPVLYRPTTHDLSHKAPK